VPPAPAAGEGCAASLRDEGVHANQMRAAITMGERGSGSKEGKGVVGSIKDPTQGGRGNWGKGVKKFEGKVAVGKIVNVGSGL